MSARSSIQRGATPIKGTTLERSEAEGQATPGEWGAVAISTEYRANTDRVSQLRTLSESEARQRSHGPEQGTADAGKRSPAHESAQLPLSMSDLAPGVGARQGPSAHPPGGGGYQDVCTGSKFEKKRDPRLDDLRRIGLQRVWIDIAEQIGVDAFLVVWRNIDADPACSLDRSSLRVTIRVYRTYLRFQRNRYIEELSRIGLSDDEIHRRLSKQFGETISLRHIKRITAAG